MFLYYFLLHIYTNVLKMRTWLLSFVYSMHCIQKVYRPPPGFYYTHFEKVKNNYWTIAAAIHPLGLYCRVAREKPRFSVKHTKTCLELAKKNLKYSKTLGENILVSLRILKLNRAVLFLCTFVCVNHLMFIGCYLSVNVFLEECVLERVTLVAILLDAHWEKQIHSEKQIVPLSWVWSGHNKKGLSERQKGREIERAGARKCVYLRPGTMYTLPFSLIICLSLPFLSPPEQLLPLPLPDALICMSFHEKTSPHLTAEINFTIIECTVNSSGSLRKYLVSESIYPKKSLYLSSSLLWSTQIIVCNVELRGFCFGKQFSHPVVITVVIPFVLGSIFKNWGFMGIDVFNLVLLTC